jgi:ribosomal protein S18 acetylase RimI-like enzyme
MPATPPASTERAPADALFELVGLVRAELKRRGDPLAPEWVDQAVSDLRAGTLKGWYYPPSPGPGGLGFFSVGGRRAYGHVHVEMAPEQAERALALVEALLAQLPAGVNRCDIGITGLPETAERALAETLLAHGGEIVVRWAMERPIDPRDGRDIGPPPADLRHERPANVTLDALVALDERAFRGTPDETLIADSVADHRRVVREILDGRLGRFVEEASTILLDGTNQVVGAVLSAEENPRKAVLLDLLVDPALKRRGVGRYLLHWVFRAGYALGYSSVGLWVTEANLPARQLYDREGFAPRLSATIYRWSRTPVSEPPAPATVGA